MDRFWTPWRGDYLLNDLGADECECILCRMAALQPDKENLVLHHSRHSFVVMNKYPYNSGHIMIVPKSHVDSLEALGDAEYEDLCKLLRRSVSVLYGAYNPQGCNVGMNMGRSAGAGIDKHLHFHAVPRWNGDTNFLPVFSEVKVISEHLFGSYEKLVEKFREINV